MADIAVPAQAQLTLRLTFDGNARYSIYLFVQDAAGAWSNSPIQADAAVLGQGAVEFPLGPVTAGAHWALVTSANLVPTELPGDVSCQVELLLGAQAKAAQTVSGKVTGAGHHLPCQVRFDITTS